MNSNQSYRGAAPVGFVSELPQIEAASVIYLRLWCEGPELQEEVWSDFRSAFGDEYGQTLRESFHDLCGMCCVHGRRPLMRHSVECKCLGADESCFATFVSAAADGEREDALMMATLIVRPDLAPIVTSLATQIGLALKKMQLSSSKSISDLNTQLATIH